MQFAYTKRHRFGQKAQVRRGSKNDKTVKIEVKIEANGSKSKHHGGIESMTWIDFAKRQNTAFLNQNRPPRRFDAAAGICYTCLKCPMRRRGAAAGGRTARKGAAVPMFRPQRLPYNMER